MSLHLNPNAALLALNDKINKIKESIVVIRGDKGDRGSDGDKGAAGPKGDTGAKGPQGAKGDQGIQGNAGKQGISVVKAEVAFDNHLVITLSDGSEVDAGEIDTSLGQDKKKRGSTSITMGAANVQEINGLEEFILDITGGSMGTQLTDGAGDYKYVGEAASGSLTSDPVWRIRRTEYLGGDDSATRWAQGKREYAFAWDDRALEEYI